MRTSGCSMQLYKSFMHKTACFVQFYGSLMYRQGSLMQYYGSLMCRQGCLIQLYRSFMQKEGRLNQIVCIIVGAFCEVSTYSFLSLFVVTKSNQKRPDKKNSLRLRLRSNSFLSQRNGLFYASRSMIRVYPRWHLCTGKDA